MVRGQPIASELPKLESFGWRRNRGHISVELQRNDWFGDPWELKHRRSWRDLGRGLCLAFCTLLSLLVWCFAWVSRCSFAFGMCLKATVRCGIATMRTFFKASKNPAFHGSMTSSSLNCPSAHLATHAQVFDQMQFIRGLTQCRRRQSLLDRSGLLPARATCRR